MDSPSPGRKRLIPRSVVAWILAIVFITAAAIISREYPWSSPRRRAIQPADRLASAVASRNQAEAAKYVQLPESSSQLLEGDAIIDTLKEEISPRGVSILARKGQFGPLREVFPAEVDRWAKAFGVNPDHCVAFRMEKDGLRAELVILQQGDSFRVLRCNNVKQMAERSL